MSSKPERYIDPSVSRLLGLMPESLPQSDELLKKIEPTLIAKERLRIQEIEIMLINQDADEIESVFEEKNLPIPSAYVVFTSGYEIPESAELIGKYGKYPFEGFPAPAAGGHAGEVYAVRDQDKSIMILKGRAHPNEWTNETYGSIIVAHPLRVVQELIRRKRAETGENPPVVLTYVCGVAKDFPMGRGDLGIMIDDAEATNVLHPGHGPVELFDEYIGPHFQPKMERTSDQDLSLKFYNLAKTKGVPVFPATILGTAGTTEYQGWLEMGQAITMFEKAKDLGLLRYSKKIFGEKGEDISPLLGMGNTFEFATLRQTFFGEEEDIRKIGIGLATDIGGEESTTINHEEVVKNAMATGERNTNLIMNFLHQIINESEKMVERNDYSIKAKLQNL